MVPDVKPCVHLLVLFEETKNCFLLTGTAVAFSASLTYVINHMQKGHIVHFDHVILNEGNHYVVSTGVFTAPSGGIYLFSYSDAQQGIYSTRSYLSLVVNGRKMNGVVADSGHDHNTVQGK